MTSTALIQKWHPESVDAVALSLCSAFIGTVGACFRGYERQSLNSSLSLLLTS